MKLVARHYRTGVPVCVHVQDGRFISFDPIDTPPGNLPWLAPGLVDVQVNGFGGVDFNRPPSEPSSWDKACASIYAAGCTGFLITFISHGKNEAEALATQWENCRRNNPHNCLGYHLEGPFLNPSPGTCGVHPTEVMEPADLAWMKGPWKQIGPQIRVVTLAPEIAEEAALEFIQECRKRNIQVSIGHSLAMGQVLERAVKAGASSWTHLGNAVGNPMSKFENVIFHALDRSELRIFLIPDGRHVPAPAFGVMTRAARGGWLLTTDAMSAAGAGPGTFTLGPVEVMVGDEGVALHPLTGRLAGSTLCAFDGVFQAAKLSGVNWSEAWNAFSVKPAEWLGFDVQLETGNEANFCLFELKPKPRLLATLHRGEVKYGSLT